MHSPILRLFPWWLCAIALPCRAATPSIAPIPAPVERITPAGEHCFFGYYDLPAYDPATGRHLVHRVSFRDRLPTASDIAELGVITLDHPGEFKSFAQTTAWNFQQGALLQWLGDGSGRAFFNEKAPNQRGYRGVLLDLASGQRRYTDRALANVSADGRWGLGINFDRLYDFRPGYGYAAGPDAFRDQLHPTDDGVWFCDLRTGQSRLVLSLATLFERVGALSPYMQRKLLVNHINFNPGGTRFVMLLRNFPEPAAARQAGSPWRTILLTAARDGTDLHILVPPGFASHYHWRDDATLVCYCDGPQGVQLYEITDTTPAAFTALDPAFFLRDGHCSYSPDRQWLLYDSYPDAQQKQHLYVYNLRAHRGVDVAQLGTLPVPVIDIRCDLHPRWLSSERVTLDSVHDGYRASYQVDLRPWTTVEGSAAP